MPPLIPRLLCVAVLTGLLPHAKARADEPLQRPNVLIILPDQMRGMAMGCMGDPDVKTPNLDRLASQGLLLRRVFANTPVCCPARAIMLTGTYAHQNGMVANDLRLRESKTTIAEILAARDYRTGYIGKWHLDGGPRLPGFIPPGPRRQGFQFWAANECSHQHFKPTYFRDTADPITDPRFEPEVWTDLAIEFLQTKDDRPFFLMVSMGPPHDPYGAPDRYQKLYDPAKLTMRPNWGRRHHAVRPRPDRPLRRRDLRHRRPGRPLAESARRIGTRREHDRPVHVRPRQHARLSGQFPQAKALGRIHPRPRHRPLSVEDQARTDQ